MIDYLKVGAINLTYQRLLMRWDQTPTHDLIELARAETNNQPTEFALLLERVRANLLRLIDAIGPGRTSGQVLASMFATANEVASCATIYQLVSDIDALDKLEERFD